MKQHEHVYIFDTTLRDGEQAPGCAMDQHQKIAIAKCLERLGVDLIEAGFPVSSPMDHDSVQGIAEIIENSYVVGLARAVEGDIEAAGSALAPAFARGNGRIHTFIATSDLHTEEKLRKSKEEVIDMAVRSIEQARTYTSDVEFSSEDFGRSDNAYIADIVEAAINAGATTINLPDTVGYLTPEEMYFKVKGVLTRLENKGINLGDVIFSTHNHNDLGNATANSLAAVRAGVRQVEGTFLGIGERAGNAALEQVIANIRERGRYEVNPISKKKDPYFGLDVSHIDVSLFPEIAKIIANVLEIEVPFNQPLVGRNPFCHESGVHQHGVLNNIRTYEWMGASDYGAVSRLTLGPRSGKAAIADGLKNLGYIPVDAEMSLIAERFAQYADGWRFTDDAHLVQAVYEESEVPEHCKIALADSGDFYDRDTGSQGKARLKLVFDGKAHMVEGIGNGSIDAVTNAFQKAFPGLKFDIETYKSRAIGEGASAVGKEFIRIRSNGYATLGIGKDTSTVIGAAKALGQAVNRMHYVHSRLGV